MKVYSFLSARKEPLIGLDMGGTLYNFTRCWEIFKELQTSGRGPALNFLQIMIELDYFSAQGFEEVMNIIKAVRPLSDLQIRDEMQFAIPIDRPSKIICLGRNYAEHARETGAEPPSEPIIFAKAPSSMISHQGTIVISKALGRVDHEAELAVVIGKSGKNISEAMAEEHIAGYTIMNDVTARARQKKDIEAGQPWFFCKGIDTFGPIGPCIVPAGSIDDPHNLDITLRVNGEIRQRSNTSKMIFKIPKIIAYISKYMTLNCGDIISTGTPEGISALKDGDIVEVEISQIGVLRNFVVEIS